MTSFLTGKPDASLSVNENNHWHYRILGKSREAGEKDLRALTRQDSLEEGWLFVEGVDRDGNTIPIWYEVGTHQRETAVHIDDIIVEKTALEDLKELGIKPQSATLYHFHSDQILEKEEKLPEHFSNLDYFSAGTMLPCFAPWKVERADARIVVPNGIWRLTPRADDASAWRRILHAAVEYGRYHKTCGEPDNFIGHIPIIGIMVAQKNCPPSEIIEKFSTQDVTIDFTPF